MSVQKITQTDFQKEVLESEKPVLVDFYADWCAPCKITSPIIAELSEEIHDLKFVEVNVDENQNLASQYSIFSIPSFLIFKGGQVVTQFVGAQSKESFQEEIQKAVTG